MLSTRKAYWLIDTFSLFKKKINGSIIFRPSDRQTFAIDKLSNNSCLKTVFANRISPTRGSRLCLVSSVSSLRLQLHGAIYRPDSFVLMLRYCANLKAIRYESTSLNRIVADKSHRVIVA